MQKRVLLIALVAFSGGAMTTLFAASYLTSPAPPDAKPAVDLSRVQTVAPTPDEPACPPRTWPYFGPDCTRKPNRGTEAKILSDVAFITPANPAADPVRLAFAATALQPVTKIETVAAASPAAAVTPAPLAKAVDPLRAPQATEPMRTVEFERSTDAAARQVRLIRIDRGPADPAETGSTPPKPAAVQAAASPPSTPATTERAASLVAQAAAPKPDAALPTAVPAAPPAAPALAKAEPAATSVDAKGRAVGSATSAAALPPAPSPPDAVQPDKNLDRNANRSRRRVARGEDDRDYRSRRGRDERYSRRDSRYDEQPAPDAQVRGPDRRGRFAQEDAPPARGRRSSAADRDVYGWLGSSN